MKPIDHLKQLKLESNRSKHPSFPDHLRPRPSYQTTTANGLTRAIIDYIQLNGGQAERIGSMGRVVKRNGVSRYIPGTSTKGTADISSTIKGRSVKIEVKVGKDRQSEYQKLYQADVERAGGVYYIARTFDEFYEWYQQFTS